jgi:hypothetical protein
MKSKEISSRLNKIADELDQVNPELEVYFHNVEIGIAAKDAETAYSMLAEVLGREDFEYTTDTYSTNNSDSERPVSELWPSEG